MRFRSTMQSLALCSALLSPAAAQAQPSGTLTVAVPSLGRETLDLGRTNSNDLIYTEHLYDALIGSRPDGEIAPERGLAESWEMSADSRVLTVRLRDGVAWHDGKPMTSDDVLFSLAERFVARDAVCTFCGFLRTLVHSIEAPDARTVVIRLKQSDPTFFAFLSSRDSDLRVLPRHGYRATADGFEPVGDAIGTGPWRYRGLRRGVEMTFSANTTYWDRERIPQFEVLRLVPRPQPTARLAMVRAGEADMAFIDPAQIADARSAGLTVQSQQGVNLSIITFLGCWQREMLCNQLSFRRAMVHAIDMDAIVERVFPDGSGRRIANSIWTERALGFDPALRPHGYDPDLARRLLREIRYDGRPVKIWSVPGTASPETPEIMELVEGYLREAGFRTELTPIEFGAFRPRFANDPQNFETRYAAHLHLNSAGSRPMVIQNLTVSWISKRAGGLIQAYHDLDRIDAVVARLRGLPNLQALDTELRTLNRETHQEYAFLPVVARSNTAVLGPRIAGWSPSDFGFGRHLETVRRRP